MTTTFLLTKEECLEAVKMESSYIAERTENFDMLVFDEEYGALFQRLFEEARAMVEYELSAYAARVTEEEMADLLTNAAEDDFVLVLDMPEKWKRSMKNAMNTKIRSFVSNHILYRWLDGKMPDMAAGFRDRASEDIKRASFMAETRAERRGIRPCPPW